MKTPTRDRPVGPTLPASTGTAQTRMTRVLFAGTAGTGIVFSLVALPGTLEQSPYLAAPWVVLFTGLLWGLPVLMLLTAVRAPLAWPRGMAIAYVAAYPAAVISWPLAQNAPRIESGHQPWVIDLLSVACFSAAIVLPTIGAWIYLVVACLLDGALRFVADGSRDLAIPVQDTLFNAVTVAVFVAMIIVTLRAGARRDIEAQATAADAVIAAAAEAESAERAHVAALTHDDVISTLLAAARATEVTGPLVRRSATRALERLDALSEVEPDARAEVDAETLARSVEESVTAIFESCAVVRSVGEPLAVPAVVARALVEATGEAVRNSVRHAGEGAFRAVTVITDAESVSVEIVDDGVGFDPHAIALERFGIRYSIRHRMAAVPGGSAEIDAAPGEGTRVLLRWAAAS